MSPPRILDTLLVPAKIGALLGNHNGEALDLAGLGRRGQSDERAQGQGADCFELNHDGNIPPFLVDFALF